MKNNPDLLPSKSVHWSTPDKLYKYFMDHGYIDPCPLHSEEDGLCKQFYKVNIFVNPPFSDLSKWVDWCIEQYHNGCKVVILLPSRTDTKYFHKLLKCSPMLYFFEGRLQFGNSGKNAPFPCCLVHLEQTFLMIHAYQFGSIEKYIHK